MGNRNRAPMAAADLQQARYLHWLLGRIRAELNEHLEDVLTELVRLERIGDEHRVRSKRHIIKALESEARSIDRMRTALQLRLS